MAETLVHSCDWCGDIVDKTREGKPCFAATITSETRGLGASTPVKNDICRVCLKAYEALTKGQYRR
ncbi:hypothetical protein [Mycolicibacterium sphagni]|uniref:hypothetical protein n=1 Tax=Mycolicibacterium sphagni TaxID=1786 RepID=UPI0021F2EF67|nr:hypothetical protein [Mycolicibacterium sphagni]MCV7174753.1 hypothetical protein [Mycolicibacterium sphagni]